MANKSQLLLALPLLGLAGVTLAQNVPQRGPAVQRAPISVQQLRQRFPAQPQPGRVVRRLRAGGAANWYKPGSIQINMEAIAVGKIAALLKTSFAGKAVGWSVTVMSPNGSAASAAGGDARRAPDSAPRAMSDKERISIASVSKTITAATMMRVMAQKNVDLDSPVYLQLPQSWTFSAGFKGITIRQLMSHQSGLWDDNCGIDLATLQACAAKAPVAKNWHYANTNYAYQRLMLVQMYGLPATTAAEYGNQYTTIVNRQTFNSAGMPFLTCKAPQPNPALSYESVKDDGAVPGTAADFDFTTVKPGQDWGDMTEYCGSQGWNLTSRELAKFMHDLMLTERILPQTTVDVMRTDGLGLFYGKYPNGLESYGHGGWHPAGWNDGEVNTMILTFSNGITVGAVINSRYNGDLTGDIATAVKAGAG